jgi:hypothetical protein
MGPGQDGCYWDPDLGGECDLTGYWSSSTPSDPAYAWMILFYYGSVAEYHTGFYWGEVRCVHTGT